MSKHPGQRALEEVDGILKSRNSHSVSEFPLWPARFYQITDYVADLRARLEKAEAERDEADRRAGASERWLADANTTISARNRWLSDAKQARGYHDNVSFDRVWKETCELADRALKNPS